MAKCSCGTVMVINNTLAQCPNCHRTIYICPDCQQGFDQCDCSFENGNWSVSSEPLVFGQDTKSEYNVKLTGSAKCRGSSGKRK
jgi:hypothetical protein